jgi:hypothetical protein
LISNHRPSARRFPGEEKSLALLISIILFGIFCADIFLGAFTGTSFLNDVQEMLVLFATTIAFVVAVLRREKQSKQ